MSEETDNNGESIFQEALVVDRDEAISDLAEEFLAIIVQELNLRRFSREKYIGQLKILMMNLVYAKVHANELLRISKNRNHYSLRYFSKTSYQVLVNNILGSLKDLGLIDEVVSGRYQGEQTVIRPIGALADAIDNVCRHLNLTFSLDMSSCSFIFLEDQTKNLINFEDTEETTQVERNIAEINSALENYFIDIYCTDEEFSHQLIGDGREPNLLRKYLRRTFRPDFEHCGRFAGAWWQNIRSQWRRLIVIHNEHTVECDYSSMNAYLAYGVAGEQVPKGDLYHLDDLSADEARGLIKKAFLIMLNTLSRRSALETIRHKTNCVSMGIAPTNLVDSIENKHAALSEYFYTNIGNRLQKIESDISELVMLRAIRERNTVVLPVYDSFIIQLDHADWLKETMLDCFKEVVGIEGPATFEYESPYPPFEIPNTSEEWAKRQRYFDNKRAWEISQGLPLDEATIAPNNVFSPS